MNRADLTLEDRADSLMGSLQRHSKKVLGAAVAIAAIAGAYYFTNASNATKTAAAEQSYYRAQQSVASGNIPLATTDLRRTLDRFQGTPAGNQAALALAQLLYDQGKYADGVKVVERVEAKSESERSSKESLIAAGLEGQGKFAEAAARYQAAAAVSTFSGEKSILRANAARAFMAAGRKSDAQAIWAELAKDPDTGLAEEAKIRLGELAAKAV
jgi:predicted negative regulator of RcsB-dependent stress response